MGITSDCTYPCLLQCSGKETTIKMDGRAMYDRKCAKMFQEQQMQEQFNSFLKTDRMLAGNFKSEERVMYKRRMREQSERDAERQQDHALIAMQERQLQREAQLQEERIADVLDKKKTQKLCEELEIRR